MKKLIAILVALLASASALATGNHQGCKYDCPQEPPVVVTPPAQSPATATGTGTGTGYGGQANAQAAADAISNALAKNDNTSVQKLWSSLDSSQKTEVALKLNLNADMKNQFSGAVNGTLKTGDSTSSATGGKGGGGGKGEASASTGAINASSGPSTSSSSSQGSSGNNTTTNVGGTLYNYSSPVAGAFVQLPPNIVPQGTMSIITTTCGGDFSVEEARKVKSLSNVFFGLWPITHDNGVVSETKTGATGLTYGHWEVTGKDGEQIVQERTVNGYQAIIYAYLAGSSASSGVNYNGTNGAGALSGSGGIQTFGKEIDKIPCSFKETRRLTPVKVTEAPKPAVAPEATARSDAQASLRLERDKVPGKVIGHRLVKKARTCNGKPIPEDMTCVAVREQIGVLTDAEIQLIRMKAEAQAKASAVAAAKKP